MFTIIKTLLGKLNIAKFLAGYKLYLIGGVVISVMFAGAYFYYNYSQDKIASLNKEITTLQFAKQVQDQTIKALTDRMIASQKANDELSKKFAIIEENSRNLSKIFESHDLDNIAKSKPTLVERRVNDATKKVLQDFETITQPGGF